MQKNDKTYSTWPQNAEQKKPEQVVERLSLL